MPGYRGIWYAVGPTGNEYAYKYSGGLGAYCMKHRPMAVYCSEVNKTFFCYGGTAEATNTQLLHMVSYFDHATGTVPRPVIVCNKNTSDAHDNPVIAVDNDGYVWIFSPSHGNMTTPSAIYRSTDPYDIAAFEEVSAVYEVEDGSMVALTNFSYPQLRHVPGHGFILFLTKYDYGVRRTSCLVTSPDGRSWSTIQRLAMFGEGHYQVSAVLGANKAATAFNYHPEPVGLNARTNLYYMETPDFGASWRNVSGRPIEIPLATATNDALVRDYEAEGRLVYLKDITFDAAGNPLILYVTSETYAPGPGGRPHEWWLAHWDGTQWRFLHAFDSDHNYDAGEVSIESDGAWRIVAPSDPIAGRDYFTGGEMVMWESRDQGASWRRTRVLTGGSSREHTYARRPLNAHPGFYAFWADGNPRAESSSSLYFTTQTGDTTYRLPTTMESTTARPQALPTPERVPLHFECEDIPYTAGGAPVDVQYQTDGASDNRWVRLAADGAGDWIEFSLPDSIRDGVYTVRVRYKGYTKRGIMQCSGPEGMGIGPSVDQYLSPGYVDTTFGLVTLVKGANRVLRFACTGKRAEASQYHLSFDAITLEPEQTRVQPGPQRVGNSHRRGQLFDLRGRKVACGVRSDADRNDDRVGAGVYFTVPNSTGRGVSTRLHVR